MAPGIGKLVTHRQVLTPVDLERDYGLTGGHPLHAEPGLDQFYAWRPMFGHARYRIGGSTACTSAAPAPTPAAASPAAPARTPPARSSPT